MPPGPTPSGGYLAQRPGPTPSGGYPAQRPSGSGFGSGENRTPLLIAIGVVAVVLVVILILLANRSNGDNAQEPSDGGSSDTTEEGTETTEAEADSANASDYTPEFQTQFMEACVGGESSEAECQCALDYLMENVSIDDAVAWGADTSSNPDINAAIADCQE